MLLFTKKYKSIYEVFETYMHSSNYEDIDFVFDVVHISLKDFIDRFIFFCK